MGLFGFKIPLMTKVEQNISNSVNNELKALQKQEDEIVASLQLVRAAKERVEEIEKYLSLTLKMDQDLEVLFRRIHDASIVAQGRSDHTLQEIHRRSAEEAFRRVMAIDEEAEQLAEKEGVEFRYVRKLDSDLAADVRTLRGFLVDLQRYAKRTRERARKILDMALEAMDTLSPPPSAERLAARRAQQEEHARITTKMSEIGKVSRTR